MLYRAQAFSYQANAAFLSKSKSAAACTPTLCSCMLTDGLSALDCTSSALSVASTAILSSCIGLLLCVVAHYTSLAATQHADRLPYGHTSIDHADYDILIAAGGDGTINQVVNELVDQDAPKETCLAVIPLGTANDFATSLTIHDDNLVQAMQTAVQGAYHLACCCNLICTASQITLTPS